MARSPRSALATTVPSPGPPSLPTLSGLRIGLMLYGDILQCTGGNIYDRELLRVLTTLGATGTVLSLRDPGSPSRVGATIPEVLARLEAEPFDILLQDELCHAVLNEVNAALGASRRPLRIALVHNLGHRSAVGESRERCRRSEDRFVRSVHGCVTNSRFTLREVEALAQTVPPGLVAYPSVGPHLGETVPVQPRRRHRDDPIRVLSVANLSAVKGIHHLLDALAALEGHPWSLELVGSTTRDPGYVTSITRQVESAGLAGRVQLAGELRGAALRQAYARADAMVLASPAEGFGIACLEAMRYGLPVIASADGAAPELITHGEDGLLVDPTDHRAFVAMLGRLFVETSLGPRLGAAARARALRHPTWEATGIRVAGFLVAQCSTSRVAARATQPMR